MRRSVGTIELVLPVGIVLGLLYFLTLKVIEVFWDVYAGYFLPEPLRSLIVVVSEV